MRMKRNIATGNTTAAGMRRMIADIRTEAVRDVDVSPTATGYIPALPVATLPGEEVLQVWTRNAAGRSPAEVVNIPMKEGLLPVAGVPALPAAGATVVPAAAVPVLQATVAIPDSPVIPAVNLPAAVVAADMAAVPVADKPDDPYHKITNK